MTQPQHAGSATLPHWVGSRAIHHGGRRAVTFRNDAAGDSRDNLTGAGPAEQTWTYRELWLRSCAVANQLRSLGADQTQPRALLLFRPGLDFVAGFLGCQIAGWVPVPTCHPKPGRAVPRLDSAAEDCQPAVILGDHATIDGIDPARLSHQARSLPRLAIAGGDLPDADCSQWIDPESIHVDPGDLAFLQYTSGSTSDPKGVMVRHRNLLANCDAIQRGFHVELRAKDAGASDRFGPSQPAVFWLPVFHDMGLIGGILQPLYLGMETVLMSPAAFLQRPIRWLELISQKQAAISGAPNFAYQLCVDRISPNQTDDLDLSCWRTAFCGAEPIQARTLQDFAARFSVCGFERSAFYPCYGLAEATLLAAGGKGPGEPKFLKVDRQTMATGKVRVVPADRHDVRDQKLVSCGSAVKDTQLLIVEPETRTEIDSGCIGEIWLRGPGVTDGYWNTNSGKNRPAETQSAESRARFDASTTDARGGFFRTGDLGFQHDQELYITGRLKDLIILRGRNLFPQDIEATVRQTVSANRGQCVAFSTDGARGEVLAILLELPRDAHASTFDALVRLIRRAVIEVHDVDPTHIWLTRLAALPVTSSGKLRRSHCRDLFNQQQIKSLHRYKRFEAATQVPIALPDIPCSVRDADRRNIQQAAQDWMTIWLITRAGVCPSEVSLDKPFSDYGLDSMTAIELSGEIEDWSGTELTPIVAVDHPTIARLSQYIVDQIIATRSSA